MGYTNEESILYIVKFKSIIIDFCGRSIVEIMFEGQTLWIAGIYAATMASKQLLMGRCKAIYVEGDL